MSSILKALKKIENNPPPQQEERLWQYGLDEDPSPRTSVNRTNILMGAVFILLGINILVVGGRYLWSQKSVQSVRDTTEKSAIIADTQKAPAAGDPVSVSVEKASNSVSEKPVAAEKTMSPSRAKTSSTVTKPLTKTATPKKVISSGSGTQTAQKPVVPRTPAPVKTFGMPRLNLEGVAYSESSKDRFAIINGTIVREGESIEGLLVTRIHRNHVDVRSRDSVFRSRLMIQ